MIKSNEPSSSPERAGARGLASWHREPNCLGLRVELLDGKAFAFPYIHFSFAELQPTDGGDELLIVFATHRVFARGHQLSRILAALQKQAVEWMKPVALGGHMAGEESAAWIVSLKVEENQQSSDS